MADDALSKLYPDVVWAPFFDRGKFMYWKTVGRAKFTISKDGKPRMEFYKDSHVGGGSIWCRILPEGETPKDVPGEGQDQPKRPTPRSSDADPEEEDL